VVNPCVCVYTMYTGTKEPYSQLYHMTDIMAKPEEFERTAIRMVLGESHKCNLQQELAHWPHRACHVL
jgi:hypothetical protein